MWKEARDQALWGEHSVHALEGTAWLHAMKQLQGLTMKVIFQVQYSILIKKDKDAVERIDYKMGNLYSQWMNFFKEQTAFQKVLFKRGQRDKNAMLTKQKPFSELLGTIVADHDK